MGRKVQKKLVVIGDGGCGKTSLLTVYVKGYFPTDYEPTVFENYVELVAIDDKQVELSLWDTAGQEDFDRLRGLSYESSNIVMICFAVDMPTSLENVETKWIDEVRQYCPGVKVILTACKCDLREDEEVAEKLSQRSLRPTTYEEGLAVAKRIKASRYLECSAKENRGVQEAIEEGARVALGSRAHGVSGSLRQSSCCVIL